MPYTVTTLPPRPTAPTAPIEPPVCLGPPRSTVQRADEFRVRALLRRLGARPVGWGEGR